MENFNFDLGKIKTYAKKVGLLSIGILCLGSAVYLGSFAENIKGNVDIYLLKKEKAKQEKILDQKIAEEFRADQLLKQKIKERENQALIVEQKICEIALASAKKSVSQDEKISPEDYENAEKFCHDKKALPDFLKPRIVKQTELVFVEDGWQYEMLEDLEDHSTRDEPN